MPKGSPKIAEVLRELNIGQENSGACGGAGVWRQTKNAGVLRSINPTTGATIATVNCCDQRDYEFVLEQACLAQKSWSMIPAPKRGEVVRRLGEILRQHKDALGSLVSLEMGKIKSEGDGEVQEMIDMADFAVGQSRMLYGQTMHSERPLHRMYEQWHPLGVVGVISAFNFPVAVWAWNAFIAAICGNTVVWKPSSKTPLCAIAVQHMCNKVMAEMALPGLFSLVLPKDRGVSKAFVADRRIPLVSFTGSSGVGHEVAVTVAGRMGRSLLECSGNNAVIVDETADLKLALPAIVFGAVGTAGQRCTTTRRLLIHESRYDDLLQRIVNAYGQVKVGDPLDTGTLMGPLIDEKAVADFEGTVASALEQGGKILCGGKRIPGDGFFVEPTVIAIGEQTPVVKNETFAPILYALKFVALDEAISQQNDVPQGLSSAIFTNSVRHAEQFLSAIGSDCGIANVNIGTSGAEIGGAFGGEKETGGGREAGSDAWKTYMRRQTNTINWSEQLPLAQGIKFDLPDD